MMKKILSICLLALATATQAQNVQPEKTYGYLYCHMSGRGEWTAYALSRDGLNYHDLNGGNPVFDQTKLAGIEGGTRDAYICRRSDGQKGYLMVTTDMSVGAKQRLGKQETWDNYGINLLRSDDLIHWESTTFDFRKGAAIFSDPDSPDIYKDWSMVNRVWAPQIFWDPHHKWTDGRQGGYFIYYSLWNRTERPYDRMYYSWADASFTTLTKPQLLFDWGYATIDADINYLESDGLYHMMIKKEGGKPGIYTATAKNLTGPWSEPVEDDYVNFEGDKKCEGVSAFQLEGEDDWLVAYIQYSTKPRHYRICRADKNLRNFRDPQDIVGVEAPQHGSFMRLTKEEYMRLERHWSTNPNVHDPVMAREDGKYYIFGTGMYLSSLVSSDMKTWEIAGPVMPEIPKWAIDAVKGYRGHTWAPDIQRVGDTWYMYYSCSAFGKNTSAIGLMTSKSINPESADCKWEDQGMVIKSVPGKTDWNAIDPNLILDDEGQPWLTWGSFWDGIQLVKLSKDFKTPAGKPKTIARRYGRKGRNNISAEDKERAGQAPDAGANAIEAPFIIHEGGYYYLFASWDYCCKGANSNYKTVVGRSKKVSGPYLDRNGRDMAQGGGEIIAQRDGQYYGIGHNSAYKFDDQWYFMAHGYAVDTGGDSRLVLCKMHFDQDGWPVLDR